MKDLSVLEQILKLIRIPICEEKTEIEQLDRVIREWGGEYIQPLADAIFDEFQIDLKARRKMNPKLLDWIDQDMYDQLRLRVGQYYINEFGDTITKEAGYAVNLKAGYNERDGMFRIQSFEQIRDAKNWIDEKRGKATNWKRLNPCFSGS